MKVCAYCYFSDKNNTFCHKGYPHWSFRPACDKFYEVNVNYSSTTGSTTTITSLPSFSYTTTAGNTTSLSDAQVKEYLEANSNCDANIE